MTRAQIPQYRFCMTLLFLATITNASADQPTVEDKNSAVTTNSQAAPLNLSLKLRCEKLYKEFLAAACEEDLEKVLKLTADSRNQHYFVCSLKEIQKFQEHDTAKSSIAELKNDFARLASRLRLRRKQLEEMDFSDPQFIEEVQVVFGDTITNEEYINFDKQGADSGNKLPGKTAKRYLVEASSSNSATPQRLNFLLVDKQLLFSPW